VRSRVVIIGAGISGLSTAWYLAKEGIRATLIEREDRLGGLIRTDHVDGCVAEAGPDSFLSAKPEARELAAELGLSDLLIGSNDHKRVTWIWRGGRLRRMPEGMTMMVPGKLGPMIGTSVLSWPGKLRAGLDLFRRPTGKQQDRSVSEFVKDHYGQEVLDYIAEPMLAGVYGGDPAEMSVGAVMPKFLDWEARYGSLTRAARAELKPREESLFTTLKPGLQALTDTLIGRLRPEVIHGAVERIEKGWRVRVNGDWIEADQVIVACRAANVLPDFFPPIRYNSACVAAIGYRRSDIARDFEGFGFLVPKIERRSVSAGTWVNNKFDFRAPDDKVVIRLFTSGAKADWLAEAKEKFGIIAEPLFLKESVWPQSMPQYNVGHGELVRMIDEMLRDFPGLHVAGNAYQGIGIPDCIRMAKQVSDKVARLVAA
jgi:oxygen-dependent protoporphyrinogen oxidase